MVRGKIISGMGGSGAGRGQADAAPAARNKGTPSNSSSADGLRQGRLRHVKAARGLAEMQLFGHHDEIPQVAQFKVYR